MSERKRRNVNMTEGPLLKNLWLFALPMMFTNFLQMLFNTADAVIVGRFAGQQSLAAVGATSSLCFFLVTLFTGLSMGSNVLIARCLGAGDGDRVRRAVHTSLLMSVAASLIVVATGYFCVPVFLRLMSTPSDIIGMSTLYLRIFLFGMVFGSIYNFASSVLRAKGDTKRPMMFLFVSGALNVVLNLTFVVVFHMGVAGVATATVISQGVGAVLSIATLCREDDATRFEPDRIFEWGLDLKMAWIIIKLGVPASLQGMVFSFSNLVIQSGVNSFDDSVIVAGNAAAGNIEDFCYIGMMAFQQACMTFTSQNIGAGKLSRVKNIMKISLILTIVITVSISVLIWGLGDHVLKIYTDDSTVIDVGKIRLTFVILPLVLNGILDLFVASMRGMGYSLLPTVTMICGICGIRLTWLFTVFPMKRELFIIYLCFPISWAITGLVQGIFWTKCHKNMLENGGKVI